MACDKERDETWPMIKRETRLANDKERDDYWPIIKKEMRLNLW